MSKDIYYNLQYEGTTQIDLTSFRVLICTTLIFANYYDLYLFIIISLNLNENWVEFGLGCVQFTYYH